MNMTTYDLQLHVKHTGHMTRAYMTQLQSVASSLYVTVHNMSRQTRRPKKSLGTVIFLKGSGKLRIHVECGKSATG